MARIVVAGDASSEDFARAELLADQLSASLPSFVVRKQPYATAAWSQARETTIASLKLGPLADGNTDTLVWRELGPANSAASLIGGCVEFVGFAHRYYGMTLDDEVANTLNLACEHNEVEAEAAAADQSSERAVHKIVLVGAASSAAGLVAHRLAAHGLPDGTAVSLVLVGSASGAQGSADDSDQEAAAEALADDLADAAFPLLANAAATSNLADAATHADAVVIFPDQDSGEGIEAVATVFKGIGGALSGVKAGASVTVASTVAFPSNTAALVLQRQAAALDPRRVVALSLLSQHQVQELIAQRINDGVDPDDLKVIGSEVEGVVVWGNAAGHVIVDATRATTRATDGVVAGAATAEGNSVPSMVRDTVFWNEKLPAAVAGRSAAVQALAGKRAGLALASATLEHLACMHGSSGGTQAQSAGVLVGEDSAYPFTKGMCCSLPTTCDSDGMVVVPGLSSAPQALWHAALAELEAQRNAAFEALGIDPPPAIEFPKPDNKEEDDEEEGDEGDEGKK
eukprot:m.189451 g.189451  ORF g.189451 m.189451 type:complete len:515 (-) comp18208_c0_seq1:565-2109(-)